MVIYPKYSGFSYKQASREGLALVNKAARTENWHEVVNRLVFLRDLMLRELAK
jgi:hypothetical protein